MDHYAYETVQYRMYSHQKSADLDAGSVKNTGGKSAVDTGVNEHFSPVFFTEDAPNRRFSCNKVSHYMKLFFDFFPILIFFIGYKFFGIFVATAIAILCSFLQLAFYWLKFHRIDTMILISSITIAVLGGFTLMFHNVMFIKWKPTILYFIFALAFFISGLVSKKSLLERMLHQTLQLPAAIWQRLNYIWIAFFILLAGLNLYVAYHFSTNTWVDFKLFGIIGLTLLFLLGQGLYIARFIDPSNVKGKKL